MNQQPSILQSAETTPDFDKDIAKFSPRQMEAVRHLDSGLIKFLLYGGALGGGKSYFLRWYAIRRLMVIYKLFGLRNVTGMLACEDYPSLKDRQLQKISREIPSWIGTMHQDHKEYGRCFILHEKWGGGILCFRNLTIRASTHQPSLPLSSSMNLPRMNTIIQPSPHPSQVARIAGCGVSVCGWHEPWEVSGMGG